MSSLFKLVWEHRDKIETITNAAKKNGTNTGGYAKDAASAGIDMGTQLAATQLTIWETIPRLIIRGLQFLLALVILGIYGARVGAGQRDPAAASPVWWFGMLVAAVACASALVFGLLAPFGSLSKRLKVHHWFCWDLGLFVLWIATFGVFMHLFHNRGDDDDGSGDDSSSYKGSSTATQKAAAWLDLVNACLWLISGVYNAIKTMGSRWGQRGLNRGVDRAVDFHFGAEKKEARGDEHGYPSQPAPTYHRGFADEASEPAYYASRRRSSVASMAQYQQTYYGSMRPTQGYHAV